ncbi:MAG TPA: glycosyltransferase family 9 protein [Longimicrobiales bacterium]|nr:glycosyltransferase family 9 protein [Longimicrobiales bacterium]
MANPFLKRLERAWKAAWLRGLARLLPRGAGALPDWSARPHRVLYLRYDRIGDMILATPLIRAIARSHPRMTVDVLASAGNASILEGNGDVGSVVLFNRKSLTSSLRAWRALRRARYDAIVDDHAAVSTPSLTRVLLMLASGVRHRIGVAGLANEFIYTHAVPPPPPGHQVQMASVVASAFGVTPVWSEWRMRLYPTGEERAFATARWREAAERCEVAGRRLLVNVSSHDPRRRWTDERLIEAIRRIRAHDPRLVVLVVGTLHDSASVMAIAATSGAAGLERSSLRQLLSLVEAADMVLTPDTSVTHVASAFEVPAVVLISRTNAPMFGPWRVPHRLVWSDGGTLRGIPVDEVVAAATDLLEGIPERAARVRSSEVSPSGGGA